jgi:hypothetical protein
LKLIAHSFLVPGCLRKVCSADVDREASFDLDGRAMKSRKVDRDAELPDFNKSCFGYALFYLLNQKEPSEKDQQSVQVYQHAYQDKQKKGSYPKVKDHNCNHIYSYEKGSVVDQLNGLLVTSPIMIIFEGANGSHVCCAKQVKSDYHIFDQHGHQSNEEYLGDGFAKMYQRKPFGELKRLHVINYVKR